MCCKTTVDVHWVFPNNSLPSFSVYGDFSVKNLFIKVFVTILSRKKNDSISWPQLSVLSEAGRERAQDVWPSKHD